MPERELRAAIVGGGIGGLTAALALIRKGVAVEVFEQADTVPRVGASLQLGPNALRLTDELELLPALRTIGVRPDSVDFLRWDDGTVLQHTELGAGMEDHFGAPQLDFFRPDLHRLLVDALPPGALRLGAHVASVEQDDEGVEVVLADHGRSRADFLVAADGIRSPIRQQLVGTDDPVFSGTVVYRGVVPGDEVAGLHRPGANFYWLGPYRHGVSYWISSQRLLAVNCAVQHAAWSRESWTLEAPAEEALAHFEGWHPPLLERIRLTRTMLRGAVFVRRALEHWRFGRVVLLGDAAHAMEPFQAQGAAQAIEDAFVLAECVAAEPADLTAALGRYERVRMGRAGALQASSHTAANVFYLPDGPEQRERDAGYATLHESRPWGPRQSIWEHDVRDDLRGGA